MKLKNTYSNLLDIKSAMVQLKEIILKLETENKELKQTLEEVDTAKLKIEKSLRHKHIHKIC